MLKNTCNSNIIDIGCSSGSLLHLIRKEYPDLALIASDFIIEPLEELYKQNINIPLLQFDLKQCPLPDSSIDLITCLNVLEHIDDDKKALLNLYRILKTFWHRAY